MRTAAGCRARERLGPRRLALRFPAPARIPRARRPRDRRVSGRPRPAQTTPCAGRRPPDAAPRLRRRLDRRPLRYGAQHAPAHNARRHQVSVDSQVVERRRRHSRHHVRIPVPTAPTRRKRHRGGGENTRPAMAAAVGTAEAIRARRRHGTCRDRSEQTHRRAVGGSRSPGRRAACSATSSCSNSIQMVAERSPTSRAASTPAAYRHDVRRYAGQGPGRVSRGGVTGFEAAGVAEDVTVRGLSPAALRDASRGRARRCKIRLPGRRPRKPPETNSRVRDRGPR